MLVAFSASLFAAILGLRAFAHPDVADATLVLFVVPVALCAIEFGIRGGLVAALLATSLVVGWEVAYQHNLGALGVATRATTYLIVAGSLGWLVDRRQAMEAKVERHYRLSQDLFCTLTFDGYFEELNPAWEKLLGHSRATLSSRRFVEWVHPDDREASEAEAARLSAGAAQDAEAISFRNRYRGADGEYRWLEWNATAVAEEQRVYATARDITFQQQVEETLQEQSDALERRLEDGTQALQQARLETLQRLAIATEYRDDDTHEHTQRVGRTAALIARQLGLSDDRVALMRYAAPLHDIGKVGIPDTILLKPGRLTPAEFELMQEHTEIGATILADGNFAVLRLAQQIARTHHERWDGTGYPNGLAGEAISLAGRIAAVADVFDALTHQRPYKRAWPIDDAVAEIMNLAAEQFDPRLVRAFATLDHPRLLETVEDYDLELPPPPLITPSEDNGNGASANGKSAVETALATVAQRKALPSPR